MICLGCGAKCKCQEPATFPTWPLEASLSHAALERIGAAIEDYLSGYTTRDPTGELQNLVNVIQNFLDAPVRVEDPTDEDLLA